MEKITKIKQQKGHRSNNDDIRRTKLQHQQGNHGNNKNITTKTKTPTNTATKKPWKREQ